MSKDKSEIQNIVDGFLKYLETNRKLSLLPEIISQLAQRGYEGSRMATIYSATPLSVAQEKNIREIVKNEFGCEEVIFEIDRNIIGGLKVTVGNQVLDLSFKEKLDQLAA